jgi:hypothetical protein
MDKQAYIRGVLTKYAEQKQAAGWGAIGRGIGRVIGGLGDDAVRAAAKPGIGSRIGQAVASKAPAVGSTVDRILAQTKGLTSRLINDPGLRSFLGRHGTQASTGAKAMGSEFMRGMGLSTRPFSKGVSNQLLARQNFSPEIMEYIARHMPQGAGARGLRSAFSAPNIGYQAGRYAPLAATFGIGNQIGASVNPDKYAAAPDNDRALTGNLMGGLGGLSAGSNAGQLLESGVGAQAVGGKFLGGVRQAIRNPAQARILNTTELLKAVLMKDKRMLRKLMGAKLGGLALAGAGIYGGIRGGGALQRKLRQPK